MPAIVVNHSLFRSSRGYLSDYLSGSALTPCLVREPKYYVMFRKPLLPERMANEPIIRIATTIPDLLHADAVLLFSSKRNLADPSNPPFTDSLPM